MRELDSLTLLVTPTALVRGLTEFVHNTYALYISDLSNHLILALSIDRGMFIFSAHCASQ